MTGRVWLSYARLSRASERAKDGKGASIQIAQQHENNTAYIDRVDPEHGPILYLEDDGFSAFLDVHRPDFERSLAMIKGREVGAFIGWHADRITRQVEVTARLWRVCETAGVELHTALGGVHTDPDSLYFETMIAERESRQKRNRMLESHKGKAKRGEWAGSPRAYGYAADMSAPIPDEAKIIKDLATRALNGESLASMARSLNAAGIPTVRGAANGWHPSVIKTMLVSPHLAAFRDHDGKRYPATWPAILEPSTHEALVRALTNPARRSATSTAGKYLLSGLARCGNPECGATMRATYIGRIDRTVYRCLACQRVSRTLADVDEMVKAAVVARLEEIDAAGLLASDENNRRAGELADAIEATRAERREAKALSKAGRLSVLGYADLDQGLAEREADLEAEAAALADAAAAPIRALEGATGPQAGPAWDAWAKDPSGAGLARRRALVALLVDVVILPTQRGARRFRPEDVRVTYRELT